MENEYWIECEFSILTCHLSFVRTPCEENSRAQFTFFHGIASSL